MCHCARQLPIAPLLLFGCKNIYVTDLLVCVMAYFLLHKTNKQWYHCRVWQGFGFWSNSFGLSSRLHYIESLGSIHKLRRTSLEFLAFSITWVAPLYFIRYPLNPAIMPKQTPTLSYKGQERKAHIARYMGRNLPPSTSTFCFKVQLTITLLLL
jgi:hypothetical protein